FHQTPHCGAGLVKQEQVLGSRNARYATLLRRSWIHSPNNLYKPPPPLLLRITSRYYGFRIQTKLPQTSPSQHNQQTCLLCGLSTLVAVTVVVVSSPTDMACAALPSASAADASAASARPSNSLLSSPLTMPRYPPLCSHALSATHPDTL
ncbi:hypothetical protein CC80DRAFT_299119, partial [Byssothecium circinans]